MLNRTNIYFININMLISGYAGRLSAHHSKPWKMGQAIAEYALILIVVVTAILAIKLYLQRGLQGRYKAATDYVGRVLTTARNIYTQYDPYYESSDYTTQSDSIVGSGYQDGTASKVIYDEDLRSGTSETRPAYGE